MDIVVSSGFKLICCVLKSKIENANLSDCERSELVDILNALDAEERFLVGKYFCKLPWNIGSLNILSILQKLGILTATEYVLRCDNVEEIQLILNDFLESKFELVTNLLINSTFEDSLHAIKLNVILDECLESLFKDLLLKPELNDLSLFRYTKQLAPADIQNKIMQKVLMLILGLQQSNVHEAFRNFTSWINESVDDFRFPHDLYKHLLVECIEESLNVLLKLSTSENFREWKFYLIMVRTISSTNNAIAGPYIRKHLKVRLKQCAAMPCKRNIMHMLLTARAATATTTDITTNLNNYAEWYKSNIGEMKFFLKAEEFQNILTLLNQCVCYEMEMDYLEIHAIVIISPPVLCGSLIKAYKLNCKQRLQQIKKGNLEMDAPSESIVIEDSN